MKGRFLLLSPLPVLLPLAPSAVAMTPAVCQEPRNPPFPPKVPKVLTPLLIPPFDGGPVPFRLLAGLDIKVLSGV